MEFIHASVVILTVLMSIIYYRSEAAIRMRSVPDFFLKVRKGAYGRFLFFYCLLSLTILFPFGAKAQLPDTILLDQVEVRSFQLPHLHASETKLDPIVMKSLANQHLGSALMQHSTVFVKDYGPGGLSSVSFRGTSASHTLVLWNDIPLNSPTLGQVDISSVPLFFVEEVGLLWGSKAATVRLGGVGGVITIDNKAEFNKGLHATVMQALGSYSTVSSYAAIGYSNSRIYTKTRIFRRASENNFQYLNTGIIPEQRLRQRDASYEDYGLLHEFAFLSSEKSMIKFITWNQWNHRNLPAIMTNLQRGGNPKEVREDRFSRNVLSYKYYFNENGNLELKTGVSVDYQHYFLRTTSNNGESIVSLIDTENHSLGWFNSLRIEQGLGKNLDFFSNIFFDWEQVESDNYENINIRTKLSGVGGFELKNLSRINSSISLRYDMADGKAVGFSPAFELSYHLIPENKLQLSVGYSNNYRYPNLNDLYWFPGGNPELLPEKSRTIDFSISNASSISIIELSNNLNFYMSDINNWIQWRPTSYRYWVPLNIARVFARGIEWRSDIRTSIGEIDFQLFINYAYALTTDESPVARIENSSGKQLIYIPKHNGNIFLKLSYHGNYFHWNTCHTGERNTSLSSNSTYTGKLPSYTLHHIGIGRIFEARFGQLNLEFRINNLFGVDYQAILWRPMPGRNIEGMLKISI